MAFSPNADEALARNPSTIEQSINPSESSSSFEALRNATRAQSRQAETSTLLTANPGKKSALEKDSCTASKVAPTEDHQARDIHPLVSGTFTNDRLKRNDDTLKDDAVPASQADIAGKGPSEKEDLYEKCLLDLQKFRISTPTAETHSTSVALKKDPKPRQEQSKPLVAELRDAEPLGEHDKLPIDQSRDEKEPSPKSPKEDALQNLVSQLSFLKISEPVEAPVPRKAVFQATTERAKEKSTSIPLPTRQVPDAEKENTKPAALIVDQKDPQVKTQTKFGNDTEPVPQKNSSGFTPEEMDILMRRVKVEYMEDEEWRNKVPGPTELLSMANYKKYCEKLKRLAGRVSLCETEEEEYWLDD